MESQLFIKEDARFSHGLQLPLEEVKDLRDVLGFHFKDRPKTDPADYIEQGLRQLARNVELYFRMEMTCTFPIVMPEGAEREYSSRLASMTAAYSADLSQLAVEHGLVMAEREVPEQTLMLEALAKVYGDEGVGNARDFDAVMGSQDANELEHKFQRLGIMTTQFDHYATDGFSAGDPV